MARASLFSRKLSGLQVLTALVLLLLADPAEPQTTPGRRMPAPNRVLVGG
jgi:hypothetical protein